MTKSGDVRNKKWIWWKNTLETLNLFEEHKKLNLVEWAKKLNLVKRAKKLSLVKWETLKFNLVHRRARIHTDRKKTWISARLPVPSTCFVIASGSCEEWMDARLDLTSWMDRWIREREWDWSRFKELFRVKIFVWESVGYILKCLTCAYVLIIFIL